MTRFLKNADVTGYISQTSVTSSLLKTDSAGKLVAAVAGTDYATPGTIASADKLIREVYNKTGATLTKGTVVYINDGQGNLPAVTKAIASGDSTSAQTFGIVQADITNNNNGYVVIAGGLDNMNTQGLGVGTALYLSSTTAGEYTTVKQSAPNHLVYIGVIVRDHPTQGVIEVRIQNGYELEELHNVAIASLANNHTLVWESATSLWKNKTIAAALGYTPEPAITAGTTAQYYRGDKTFQTLNTTAVAEGTNLYYTEARVSANTDVAANTAARHNAVTIGTANGLSLSTQILSLALASSSANGALSSTDWTTFNSKQAALSGTGFVKISGTTISYDNSTYLTTTSAASTYLPLAGGTMTGLIAFSNVTGNKIDFYHTTSSSGDRYGIQVQNSELRIHSGAGGDASGGITFGKSTTSTFTEALRIRNDGIVQVNGYFRTAGITTNTVVWSGGAESADFGNVLGQGTSTRSTMFRGNGTNTSVWWGGTDSLGNVIPFTAIDASSGEFGFWRNSGGVGGGAWTKIMTMNASGLTINSGNFVGNLTGNITGNAATVTTITSSQVTTALGFTPYNSTNPAGYITGYTETDTLATVTARGATTATNSIFTGGLQSRRNQTNNDYTTAALWTESFGNTTTGIAFHISGNVGKFLEMRTNGILYWENTQVVTNTGTWGINVTGTAASETLATVTGRGATTTAAITVTREAGSYGGTVQSFLITGGAGNGALTINSASAYAYLNFAQGGTTKMEMGIIGTAGGRYGSLYINRNIQVGETGASIVVYKSNGFVGINNLDPTSQLDVTGTLAVSGASTFNNSVNINGVWQTNITTSSGSWTKLSFTASNKWGDGVEYGTLGASGGAEPGVMINNMHATWHTADNGAGIRMGRSGGVSGGAWYQVATMANDEFMIAKTGNWANGGIKILSNGAVNYGNSGYRFVHNNGTWDINVTGAAGSTPSLTLTGLGSGSVNVNNASRAVYRNENGNGGNLSYAPVLHLGGSDTMWQIQGDYYSSTDLRWRAGYAGTWYAWRQIIHSANIASQSVANAVTLDGRSVGTSTNNIPFLNSTRNLIINNPESYSGEVRLGAAWDYGGIYASNALTMSTSSTQMNFVFGNAVKATLSSSTGLILGSFQGGNYNENIRLVDSAGNYSVIAFGASGTAGAGRFNFLKNPSDNFELRNAASATIYDITQAGSMTYYYNMGVGASPACRLHVQAPTVSYGQFRILNSDGSGEASMNIGRTNQSLDARWTIGQGTAGVGDTFGMYSNGANRMTLTTGGNAAFTGSVTATSFFESSDATIKTLIEDNYQVKGIESVVAKFYIKNGKEELGYFAQDVQGILPSSVTKGDDNLLSLSYREVHTAKIARLEKRVAELEQQLNLK